MRNHIIFFSGGKSSFSVADWVKTNFPEDNIVLYFTDTNWEDPDLYRFIHEASDKLKLPLLTHSMGINPIQLMFQKRVVFNNLIGECSKVLKIKVSRDFLKKGIVPKIQKWHNKNYLKEEGFREKASLYYGIAFEEMHRSEGIKRNWKDYDVQFPLIDHIINNDEVLKKHNIKQPRLYDMGFVHNNCMGRCVKAGQGHYKRLKEEMPDVYRTILMQEYHMSYFVSAYRYIIDDTVPEEDRFPDDVKELLIEELDDAYSDYFNGLSEKPKLYIHPAHTAIEKYSQIRKYSFMKKQENGVVRPLTIRDFDLMLQEEAEKEALMPKSEQLDLFDIGGCGCFVDFDDEKPACQIVG